MVDKRKLIITGIGKSNGGDVHLAKIEGVGKIDGDVNCAEFRVDGTGDLQGSLKAATAAINGIVHIHGSLHANTFNLEGKMTVDGSMISEHIRMNGMVTVKGSCETETFEANGRLHIEMLNAGQIKLTLQGASRIEEMGGEDIQIREQSSKGFGKWLQTVKGPFSNKLNAGVIEGDRIYLEYTTADIVRGGKVTIGQGCTIGSVEYKQSLDVHSSSKIIKQAQV
ncbi:protein CcmA, bactofilin family [Paenibacillus catalpae]|uniref:Protein CcmA, bactofilin family n=1 Tax=Paenibacillus catalpae TaxID=1045775 RepID=A0A1I2GUV3_9BACL|nr:polymer-forming cytoskeletal protein [Paenibacillus catalpae]SFF20361.1 protein CcmA, bactofilin family [Paenibacillus catalpae]